MGDIILCRRCELACSSLVLSRGCPRQSGPVCVALRLSRARRHHWQGPPRHQTRLTRDSSRPTGRETRASLSRRRRECSESARERAWRAALFLCGCVCARATLYALARKKVKSKNIKKTCVCECAEQHMIIHRQEQELGIQPAHIVRCSMRCIQSVSRCAGRAAGREAVS